MNIKPPKAIPLFPTKEPPLVASAVKQPESSGLSGCSHELGVPCTPTNLRSFNVSVPADTAEAGWELVGQAEEVSCSRGSAEPAVKKLPGLVPRPLTLPQAVAEAITEAAYKQGSNDNLATVAVRLVGPQQTARGRAESPAGVGSDLNMSQKAPRLQEGTHPFPVPRRSTAPSIIEAGKRCLAFKQSKLDL